MEISTPMRDTFEFGFEMFFTDWLAHLKTGTNSSKLWDRSEELLSQPVQNLPEMDLNWQIFAAAQYLTSYFGLELILCEKFFRKKEWCKPSSPLFFSSEPSADELEKGGRRMKCVCAFLKNISSTRSNTTNGTDSGTVIFLLVEFHDHVLVTTSPVRKTSGTEKLRATIACRAKTSIINQGSVDVNFNAVLSADLTRY